MRDSGVDFSVKVGGKQILGQAKMSTAVWNDTLKSYFAFLRQGVAHRDIKPSNILVLRLSNQTFGNLFLDVGTPIVSVDLLRSSARGRALGRALSVTRLGPSVRVVITACNLIKVLKRSLKATAALSKRTTPRSQEPGSIGMRPPFEHGWIRTHAPRPPSYQLKRLVRWFQQVNGRVHSPLAA